MMEDSSDDGKVVCPFDTSHRIYPERLCFHIVRCRKSILSDPSHPLYKTVKNLVSCDYDSNHVLPKSKLSEHHETCPTRWAQGIANIGLKVGPFLKVPEVTSSPFTAATEGKESWEDDLLDGPGYDGRKKMMESKTPILIGKQNVKKSERVAYRDERRVFYGGLDVAEKSSIPGLAVAEETKAKKKKKKKNAKGNQV